MIIAGAGDGKTVSLLIKSIFSRLGINPYEILALTFYKQNRKRNEGKEYQTHKFRF